MAGVAYFYWKLSRSEEAGEKRLEYLKIAEEKVETSMKDQSMVIDDSFFYGMSGVRSLAAVIYCDLEDFNKSNEHFEWILARLESDLELDSTELLVGNAGLLSCLLFLLSNLSHSKFSYEFPKITEYLFKYATPIFSGEKINYQYAEMKFLGAAHGLSGILYVLMHISEVMEDSNYRNIILKYLDKLISQHTDGIFPSIYNPEASKRKLLTKQQGKKKKEDANDSSSYSSEGEEMEEKQTKKKKIMKKSKNSGTTTVGEKKEAIQMKAVKVHWCHGSAGIVFCLVKAYEVFDDKKYLKIAKQAAEKVWEQGIVLKGLNLCHGVCGNAYSFLELYKCTKKEKYLYYAYQFCIFSADPEIRSKFIAFPDTERKEVGRPDNPLSLMEGISGEACFYLDLLHPLTAQFPGFSWDIPNISQFPTSLDAPSPSPPLSTPPASISLEINGEKEEVPAS